MNDSIKDDQDIIEGFLQGSRKDYQTVSQWVLRVVKLGSWGLERYWDDVTQDVLLKLYVSLKESKFEFRSSLKTYVYRIAKFTCIDYLRRYSSKEKKEVELLQIGVFDPPQDRQEQNQADTFWRIHGLISQECRELWEMIFWQNLPYAEIAKKLDISEGTVKSRFFRCKERAIQLKKKLAKEGNLNTPHTTIGNGGEA